MINVIILVSDKLFRILCRVKTHTHFMETMLRFRRRNELFV